MRARLPDDSRALNEMKNVDRTSPDAVAAARIMWRAAFEVAGAICLMGGVHEAWAGETTVHRVISGAVALVGAWLIGRRVRRIGRYLRTSYRIRHDRCGACGYDLSGVTRWRCPECGNEPVPL